MANCHMPNAVHYIRYRENRHTCRLINASLKIIFAKTKWDIINLNAPIRLHISDYKLLFRCKTKDYKMAHLGHEILMRTNCTYLLTTSKWESDFRPWVLAANFYYRKKKKLSSEL